VTFVRGMVIPSEFSIAKILADEKDIKMTAKSNKPNLLLMNILV